MCHELSLRALSPNCKSVSFSFHIIPPEILLKCHSVVQSPPDIVWRWLVGPHFSLNLFVAADHLQYHRVSITAGRKNTYRAPAVEAVWASLRAAVPLIMVDADYWLEEQSVPKKVMRWLDWAKFQTLARHHPKRAVPSRRPMPSVASGTKDTHTSNRQIFDNENTKITT